MLTRFQRLVQQHLNSSVQESILLVAPTGIGKTLAVTAGLSEHRKRMIYGVPLRALASGILDEIRNLRRNGRSIDAVLHHGSVQDSGLFSEEVVVTTYDQIVCAVPGLPLSLPLSAGHAVAGALLMSTLVLDEVHLAWSISTEALSILLGILDFRQKLGLQTVVMTATLPDGVAESIAKRLGMRLIVVGLDNETVNDEGLCGRNANRRVSFSFFELKRQGKEEKEVDIRPVVDLLACRKAKCIYFANTVERLHRVYDEFERTGNQLERLTVLHNRMPKRWRDEAETEVRERFGKESGPGNWILLTNQVAEAGLDISAPLVVSDPAPVDTLIQRSGRCARWFRNGLQEGEFRVIQPRSRFEDWVAPYQEKSARLAEKEISKLVGNRSSVELDWWTERRWLNAAWSGEEGKDGTEQVERCFNRMTFSLNLFDRASQQNSPGMIANAFREILSVNVAVIDNWPDEARVGELSVELRSGSEIDASSVSIKQAYGLLRNAAGRARVVRYRDDEFSVEPAVYLVPGDLLIVPPTIAYLHRKKGLCLGDGTHDRSPISSEIFKLTRRLDAGYGASRYQSLWEHTEAVMQSVSRRLRTPGDYRDTLIRIVTRLETSTDAKQLADAIADLAVLAAGFHDFGKASERWQKRAREIDPECPAGLIGRTRRTGKRMGVPHTTPGFWAAVGACDVATGGGPDTRHLVRALALASARHHSSLLNPASQRYPFSPADGTGEFVERVLTFVNLSSLEAGSVIRCAQAGGSEAEVPLMAPNDDLFPIYALIGRTILLSDREDAANGILEHWSS